MTDIESIRRVLARWMQLDDNYDDEAWLSECITGDFHFSVGEKSFQGRDTVRDLNKGRDQAGPRGTHVLGEPVIDVDGDSARAVTAYLYITPAPSGGYEVSLAGYYHDSFVKEPSGVWRCSARRNEHLDARTPA